jgi:allophanate hydrolase subunit 2
VGVITTPDRWRLAQLRPGDKVSFKPVSVLEAQKQLRDTLAELEKLKVLLMRK